MFCLYRLACPVVKSRPIAALAAFRECSAISTPPTSTTEAGAKTADGSSVAAAVSQSSQVMVDRGDIFKRYPPQSGGVVRHAWVETLNADEPKTGATVRLHPEVWSVKPRLDIIKANLEWQLNYKHMSYEHVKSRHEMPPPPSPGRPWPKKGTGRARHSSWRYVFICSHYSQSPASIFLYVWISAGTRRGLKNKKTFSVGDFTLNDLKRLTFGLPPLDYECVNTL